MAEAMPDGRTEVMDDNALLCHDLSHSWSTAENGHFVVHARAGRNIHQVRREVTCARCGMKRSDIYHYPSLELAHRKYDAPPNYYAKNQGQERIARQDYRYALLRRVGMK